MRFELDSLSIFVFVSLSHSLSFDPLTRSHEHVNVSAEHLHDYATLTNKNGVEQSNMVNISKSRACCALCAWESSERKNTRESASSPSPATHYESGRQSGEMRKREREREIRVESNGRCLCAVVIIIIIISMML